MMLKKFAMSLVLVCVLAMAASAPAAEKSSNRKTGSQNSSKPMAPEFGPSVVFDRSDGAVQLSDLRGKMAVVVFFQSWCPVCNGWSPELLQQMDKAFGDDPAVAMIAIKVDGGTPAEAKAYLRSKKADLSKWIVASDTGGVYYQRVSGTDKLWGYELVDGDGRLMERGDAGSFYPEATGKRFALADPKLKQKAHDAGTIFPADQSVPAELKPAAHAAEAGHFALALRALKSWEHGKTKDAAEKLTATLLDNLAARVTKASADLQSDNLEARYDGFHVLLSMSALSETPAGQSAKAALATLKTDKALLTDLGNEQRAEAAFWGMISRSMRLEIQQRKVQLPNAMKQFADAFTGTSYADRALNEAQTIAMGQLSE
jgi:thiol-disulfide isomerase/thioredoxin